jgi:hypothetical protein
MSESRFQNYFHVIFRFGVSVMSYVPRRSAASYRFCEDKYSISIRSSAIKNLVPFFFIHFITCRFVGVFSEASQFTVSYVSQTNRNPVTL